MIAPTAMPIARDHLGHAFGLLAEVVERGGGLDLELRVGFERGLEGGEGLRVLEPHRHRGAAAAAAVGVGDGGRVAPDLRLHESPEANTPATFHGWAPSRTSLPGVRPANWRAAPRPTISSRSPGVNLRPSMIFTCGRTAQACSLDAAQLHAALLVGGAALHRQVGGDDDLVGDDRLALGVAGDARRLRDLDDALALEHRHHLGRRGAAHDDRGVDAAGLLQRLAVALGHRQQRHQHADDAGDADDDHRRGSRAAGAGC